MKRSEALEAVGRPGKFEGEAPYVPHFWDTDFGADEEVSDGSDEPGGTIYMYSVTDEDRAEYPELDGMANVYLCERPDGFVVEKTEDEFDAMVKDAMGPDSDRDSGEWHPHIGDYGDHE